MSILTGQSVDVNGMDVGGIAYSPFLDRFVAVAQSGTPSESSYSDDDGVTWTPSTVPTSGSKTEVIWVPELSLFVATGAPVVDQNEVATSPDGDTWTPRSLPLSRSWIGPGWSPSLSLLAILTFEGGVSDEGQSATSPDGISWTLVAQDFSVITVSTSGRILWVPTAGRFINVQEDFILTSTDGVAWVITTPPEPPSGSGSPTGIGWWNDVAYSPDLNLIVAVSAGGKVTTSTNGVIWTTFNTPSPFLSTVLWDSDNQIFIALGFCNQASHAIFSFDGEEWFLFEQVNMTGSCTAFPEARESFHVPGKGIFAKTLNFLSYQVGELPSPSLVSPSGAGIAADTARRMWQLINPVAFSEE